LIVLSLFSEEYATYISKLCVDLFCTLRTFYSILMLHSERVAKGRPKRYHPNRFLINATYWQTWNEQCGMGNFGSFQLNL